MPTFGDPTAPCSSCGSTYTVHEKSDVLLKYGVPTLRDDHICSECGDHTFVWR
ncbi:hypothetical protein ACWEPC_02065 [Nonomuraea sp. NPDC004297]